MEWIRGAQIGVGCGSFPGKGHESGHCRSQAFSQIVTWLLVILSIPFLGASLVQRSAPPEPDVIRCKVLVAEKFVVQGPDGGQVAVFTRSRGVPVLALQSPRQDGSVLLGVLPNRDLIIDLRRRQGAANVVLSIAPDGSPSLRLRRNASNKISVRADSDGECNLSIGEEVGGNGARIAVTKDGSIVTLTDKLGKTRLSLSGLPEGPLLFLFDQMEAMRSSMHHRRTETSVNFFGPNQASRLELRRDVRGTSVLLLGPDANEQLLIR